MKKSMVLFLFFLILIPNLLSQSDLQTKYDSASKYAKQGNYGNALMCYLEIAVQDPNYRDVQNKIESMKASIRERVTFRVALFDFKNYSNSPALVGRIQDGILDFLLNKSFGTLEIVDRSAIDQFQREASRTGTQLAELKPISAVIEGSIYDLKVEENKVRSTESKTVEIGTHKVPNPKRTELLAAINALRFQQADYAALHQSQTNRVLSKGAFSTLFNLKQSSKKQLASSGIEFLRLLGTSGSKGKVENKIKELEGEMANLPEFIEEPVYGDVVKDEETVARIARMECYLKIRDFKTRRPLYTQTFESLKSAVGSSLNIPSKIEIESMVTREVIDSAGNKIYEELRDYGLGYYSLFELAKEKGDSLSAVEMVFNYLLSCSSPYNPEQTINCAHFINESIGLEPDSSLLANYFPEIELAKDYLEEHRAYLQAKEIYEKAVDLYNKEDYEVTIEKFKEAKERGFVSDDLDKYIINSEERLAELEREKLYSQKLTADNKDILMEAMETTDKSPYSLYELPTNISQIVVLNDIDILDTKKIIKNNGIVDEIHFSPDNEYIYFVYRLIEDRRLTSNLLNYLYNFKQKELKAIKNIPKWYNNEIKYKHDFTSDNTGFHAVFLFLDKHLILKGNYITQHNIYQTFLKNFKISDNVTISLSRFSSIQEAMQKFSVWLPNKIMLLSSLGPSGNLKKQIIEFIDPSAHRALKIGIEGSVLCISNDLKRIVYVKSHGDWHHIHLADITVK